MRGKLVLFGPFPPPTGGVSVFMSSLAASLDKLGIAHETRAYAGTGRSCMRQVAPTAASVLRGFAEGLIAAA